MQRNLDRRVEALVPVLDVELRERVGEILALCLADDVLAWKLKSDGSWKHVTEKVGVESQLEFCKQAVKRAHSA